MNEKALEVLPQYELEVLRTWKGRDVYFIEASKGRYLLKEHRGSEEKIEKLYQLLISLKDVQFFRTDLPVRTKEGNFLSRDEDEVTYLLKRWEEGRECDPRSDLDVCRSMEGLAIFHSRAKELWTFEKESQRAKYEGTDSLLEMEKRTRELKKIRTFIRKKNGKNEFEAAYLEIIPGFLAEAEEFTGRLRDSGYEAIQRRALKEGRICHGEYTQHNLLFDRSRLILTNFEHAHLGLQCTDVALFLRKIMEKQGWRIAQGEKYLHSYEVVRPMEEKERAVLGLLLAYPEKLWKLANHYYHSNKAWIPAKDIEKLKTFAGQQKERERFVNKLF